MNSFALTLLQWFDASGRKQLPWQGHDAYRVWISEIMLQQTQVTTVIPYYERFMQRFPDVHTLAAASLDEVLHLWTGLGYYARARNLHRAAQQLVKEHQGTMPTTLEVVQSLPGIGRSTAAAILAQVYELPYAILDGNVKRVLTRYFGIHGFPGSKPVESQLWALAQDHTPTSRVADYTQAIMDFGALLCTRSSPACETCPLAADCIANAQGLQSQLPTPRPRRNRPQRIAHVAVISDSTNAVLLQQRPPAGIWGGLWVCPQFEDEASCEAFVQSAVMSASSLIKLPVIHHAFTHFDLQLHPYWSANATPRHAVADGAGYCWYDPQRPARIGLAKPVLEILKMLHVNTLESVV